jgi:hypothetical protein
MNSRLFGLPDMSELIREGENNSPAGIRVPNRPALSLIAIRNTPGCQTYGTRAQDGMRKDILGTWQSLLSQILFLLPDHRLYILKNMCVYIYIYTHSD